MTFKEIVFFYMKDSSVSSGFVNKVEGTSEPVCFPQQPHLLSRYLPPGTHTHTHVFSDKTG